MIAIAHRLDGVTCYGCRRIGTVGQVTFEFPDLPYPNNWLCADCTAKRITDNVLSLDLAEATRGSCFSCGDTIEDGGLTYCSSCYDNHYDEGINDADSSCGYCGDSGEVYCFEHAKSEWELDSTECDNCGNPAETRLCAACGAKEQVVTAQAADGFEVNWE